MQVGAVGFTVAAWLAWLEASNVHLHADVCDWVRQGRKGRKPRLAFPLLRKAHVAREWLGWHGSAIRFMGTLFFVVGVATKFAGAHRALNASVKCWLWTIQFLLGALSILVGAYLIAAEARHSWLQALLPPCRLQRGSVGKWVAYVNLLGSLCFVAGSIVGFVVEDLSLHGRQLAEGLTWVLGSCLFVVKSGLLCIEGFTTM